MYPITFRKKRAAYFLDCLLTGKPVLPDREQPEWTIDEMLQLARACFFDVAGYSPQRPPTAAELEQWDHKHPEHREAEIETMMHDLHVTLEFMVELTQMGLDGDYGEKHEPVVRSLVQTVNTRMNKAVVPIEGFKGAS